MQSSQVFMVAINKIQSIERSRIKIGNEVIPVSETYKEAFFEVINNKAGSLRVADRKRTFAEVKTLFA